MSKALGPATLPEPVARFAQAEVAVGHSPSGEGVSTGRIEARIEALRERAEADEEWLL